MTGTSRWSAAPPAPAKLRDGRLDPVTQVVTPGLEVLIRGLEARFGQFGVEASTSAIIRLLTYARRSHERIDGALARYESIETQITNAAPGFDLPVPVGAWLLLQALRTPKGAWQLT